MSSVAAAAGSSLLPAVARASGGGAEELTFRAQKVEADADFRDIALAGGVEIAFGRMRIASEALRLVRRPDGGAVVEGEARLAFCPCPDPPVAITFGGGEVFPEGDITLRFPRIEVLGVPVLALPWLWLRAPHQVGVFPPSLAWRGRDGLILGSGVHVPWLGENGDPRVFQATAAGYLKGGAEVGAAFEGPSAKARATVDWRSNTRVELSARGFREFDSDRWETGAGRSLYKASAAWDLDAIRGDLGRARTPDLLAAARPYDAMAAETSLSIGDRSISGYLSTGIWGRAWRGDGRIAAGPGATFSLSGPLSSRGAWDALLTGSVLRADRADQTESAVGLALGSLGAEMTFRPGPLEVRLSSRERVRAASRGPGASADAAASARFSIGLPLLRSFGDFGGGGGGSQGPLVHIIDPSLEAQAAVEHGTGSLFRARGSSTPRSSWTAAGAISTSLGRSAGSGARAVVRAGLLGLGRPRSAGHALAAAQTPWFSGDIEAALVPSGYAVLARFRAGPPGGVELRADVAAQGGAEASAARVFSGGPSALPFAGEPWDYLSAAGLSGLTSLAIPWTRWLRTSASAAADLTAERLLAIGLGVDIEHPCGCFSLAASGAHRAGRDGVDALLSVQLTPSRR